MQKCPVLPRLGGRLHAIACLKLLVRRGPASQQAQLARLRYRGGAIAYVKLPKNPMQMSLGRAHRNKQLIGDLLIAEPTAAAPKHVDFAGAQ